MEKTVYKSIGQKSEKQRVFIPFYRDGDVFCGYTRRGKRIEFSTKNDVENFLAKKKEVNRSFVEIKRVFITYLPFKTK